MNRFVSLSIALALALTATAEAGELRGTLLSASATDFIPTTLQASKSALPAGLETQPVDFAWRLQADSKLAPPAPYVAQSREFWSLQDADQLKAGFRFDVGSAGALIRVSPAEGSVAKALDLADVALSLDGRELKSGAGILRHAAAEQLKAQGADFGAGSLVLQLDPALGAGRIELRVKAAAGRHLVHVLEPNSQDVLALTAARDTVAAGAELELYADWHHGDARKTPNLLRGLVTAPDGRSFAVDFNADGAGGQRARLQLPAEASAVAGLWEAHVFAAAKDGERELLRDAKTAFAVVAPSARLSGDFRASQDKRQGLELAIGIEAAAPGRYELRGTVYGSNAKGELVPFAMAHAARLIDAGRGEIRLRLTPKLLADAQVGAPFEVRDLELRDQGRMSLQESRSRALRLTR